MYDQILSLYVHVLPYCLWKCKVILQSGNQPTEEPMMFCVSVGDIQQACRFVCFYSTFTELYSMRICAVGALSAPDICKHLVSYRQHSSPMSVETRGV
jgi:hypothetical protein